MKEAKKKGWLEKLKDVDNKSGLDFVGFENGVPKWRGGWKNGPPLWFCRMFLAIATTLLTAGILTGIFAPGKASEATVALCLAGAIHTIVSAVMFRWRRNYEGLLPVEKVTERLGVDAETMQQIAAEKGIKPRTIINEEPMFNLHDFGDVGTLVRASSAPVHPETLLRPTMPNDSTTSPNELLRASSAEADRGRITMPVEEEPQERIVLGGGGKE